MVFIKEPEGPWPCDQCGQEGRINANGTHECFNVACTNFPYITEQNRDKWNEVLKRLHEGGH